MKNNSDYKNSALEALKGNWPAAIVTAIVYMAVVMVCTAPSALSGNDPSIMISPVMALATGGGSFILTLLFLSPLQVGYYNTFRKLYQEGSASLTGNMFKEIYRKNGYESRLLSRTTEDAVTVTSVLVPWNTCGMTQATILSVPTLVYLPYCFFNLISPLMSIFMAILGYKIKQHHAENQS